MDFRATIPNVALETPESVADYDLLLNSTEDFALPNSRRPLLGSESDPAVENLCEVDSNYFQDLPPHLLEIRLALKLIFKLCRVNDRNRG